MADTAMLTGATAVGSTLHIPIAQLTPLLAAPSTRSVKAIVTLTWPYSSATGSIAFLLAEPDFRLRRTRGQVRVQFAGSSAKAVANVGIASGDEVILCLDGVEWVHDENPFATPGRGVEFDLKFKERLFLQFRREDSQETMLIDIDHPTPEPEPPSQVQVPFPEVVESSSFTANSSASLNRLSPVANSGNEWSSPAFIKRARMSYGSLFDKEYDPFTEEDGAVRGKGRKRTRLSSTWRYESRSPTPEVEREPDSNTSLEAIAQPPTVMTDEGCQTVGLDDGNAAEVLVDFHKQASNVESNSYTEANNTIVMEELLGQVNSEPPENSASLLVIQTQLSQDKPKPQEQESHLESAAPKLPSSPRLQPITSATLPLVSPLITNKFDQLLGMSSKQEIVNQVPRSNEQALVASEEPVPPTVVDEQEDLYGASPVAIHGQAHLNDSNGFHVPSVVVDGFDEASNTAHSLSEDQYGHWQSAMAQLSQDGSPYRALDDVGKEGHLDGFCDGERQEEMDSQTKGLPISGVDHQILQQYPDLDEGTDAQQSITSWGPGSVGTTHPDLPEADDTLNTSRHVQQALHLGAAEISRSGSAQSLAKSAMDLTESSDGEDVEEQDGEEIPLVGPIDEDYEGSEISQEGSESDENEPIPRHVYDYKPVKEPTDNEEEDSTDDERIEHLRLRGDVLVDNEDAPQYSEDEEDIFEDEQYQEYPPGFDPEQQEDFDEEEDEGSYEEDMEEDEDPRVQRGPVVIDLLSSDDEDSGEAPASKSEFATPPREAESESESPQSSGNEADEDMDAEDAKDKRSEPDEDVDDSNARPGLLPASLSHASRLLETEKFENEYEDEPFAIEDDNNYTANGEDDNELPDTADEDRIEEDKSIDGVHTPSREEFDQNTKRMQPDKILEDEESSRNAEEDEPATEKIEGLSHERHALEVLEENLENPKLEKQDEDSGSNRVIKQYSENVPPPPPSQVFNMDGANDERVPSLYPVLLKEVAAVQSMTASDSEQTSQDVIFSEDQPFRQTNDQLPTPDATQISLVKGTSEISILPVTNHTGPSQPLQLSLDESTIDSALAMPAQLMEEGKYMSSSDGVANVETKTTGTETIDDDTATISVEENSIEKVRHSKAAEVIVEAHNTRSRTRQQNESLEPIVQEEAQSLELVAHVSPRRSHRRGKSTSSVTEPPQLNVPITPSKSPAKANKEESTSIRTNGSPPIILDERTPPKGHDASIELAMSALDSPVKQPHDLRSKQTNVDFKVKLTRSLRNELMEYTSLKVLRYHINQKLDVLGIATTIPPEPERAKGGPRQYQITFSITDQSIAPGGLPPVTEIIVFRPYKDALPIVKVGDGILLRNFQVIAVKNKGFALQSGETSSWAVFSGSAEEVEVRGPPVEYGAGEKKHISMLRSWFNDLEPIAMEKIKKANGIKALSKAF